MFCSKCGNSIPEGHSFCGKCGSSVVQPTLDEGKKSGTGAATTILRTIGIAAALLLAVMLGIRFLSSNGGGSSSAGINRFAPTIRHETQKLVSGSHTIEPMQMSSFKFTILPEMRNARVHGHFEAEGGAGNDIQVFLADEDGYANAKNGHQYRAFYSSPKVTADSLDVMLAPGTYYLVFNNKFSLFSNKAYTADILMEYDRGL